MVSSFTDAKIRISHDEMEAYLQLPPVSHEETYQYSEVISFLKAGKIVQGIDENMVHQMVDQGIYGREVCVAKGVAAVDGEDGYFEYNFNRELNAKPRLNADGSVDYRSIHLIELVVEGQEIVIYHDAVDGKDGITVTGKVVPAKRGRSQPPLSGKGFSRSGDNRIYTADVSGKIELNNNRIFIQPIYEIQGDVDIHTGDIDFRGDIVVHGSVLAGATVKTTGSITVDGICESCCLIAGKDIVLRGGVLGGGAAKIISKANIHAKFLENCKVEAEGFIELSYALNSEVVSFDHIYVNGKKANIVGGNTYATCGIDVNTLGNDSEVKTEVRVGVSQKITKQINDLNNQITEDQAVVKKITNGLQQYDRISKEKGIDNSQDERRIMLLRTKMSTQAKLAEYTRELERLNTIVEKGKGASVKVIHDVNPGTVVVIDEVRLPVKEEQSAVEFSMVRGKVVMLSLKDELVG